MKKVERTLAHEELIFLEIYISKPGIFESLLRTIRIHLSMNLHKQKEKRRCLLKYENKIESFDSNC